MKRISSVEGFSPNADSKILFDTNVLITLFFTAGRANAARQQKYASLYKKIVDQKSKILITSHTVSEFVYRFLKLDHDLVREEDGTIQDFKRDYRPSAHCKDAVVELQTILSRNILPYSICVDDSFSSVSLQQVMQNLDKLDYNDFVISHIAARENAIVATDDYDFHYSPNLPPLITTNSRLLAEDGK